MKYFYREITGRQRTSPRIYSRRGVQLQAIRKTMQDAEWATHIAIIEQYGQRERVLEVLTNTVGHFDKYTL